MWELQTHMHATMAPSIWKGALENGDPYEQWLAERYADQRWDEDTGDEGYDALVAEALSIIERTDPHVVVEAIAELAIEYGCTTNGGHEVYLDSCTSVPWATEAEIESWYG